MSFIDVNAVSQADRIVDAVCQSSKVSVEGKKWLKLAIDPFPDETRICGGYPDCISSKSNVYPLQVTSSISGSAFATPWDCLIAFNGFTESVPLVKVTRSGNKFSLPLAGTTDFGGIQVRSALTGTALDPSTITANLFAGTPNDRPVRVISAGLEVHNMTEPLYRSGKVLCFRQPTVPLTRGTIGALDALNTTVAPADGIRLISLPESLADVQNIPDTTNWDAEEGGYLVFALDGPTNPPHNTASSGGQTVPWAISNSGQNYAPTITGGTPSQSFAAVSDSSIPFNNCGMYFTDLSPQTKLDLVWHLVVEAFPPPTDRTLTSMSTPSAAYDPEALVLYSRALRQLPIAVPVSENGLGTFFLEAAKSIASWAAPKLLKGLDSEEKKEDHELAKIKAELEILRELAIQRTSAHMPPKPRNVIASPTGGAHIVPAPNTSVHKPQQPRAVVGNVSSSAPVPKRMLSTTMKPTASQPSKKKKTNNNGGLGN